MSRKVVISLILVVFWMIFIFFMSSMDANNSNNKSTNVAVGIISTVDKVAKPSSEIIKKHQEKSYIERINILIRKSSHALEYLILGILVLNVFYQLKKYHLLYAFYTVLFNFLYAITDEYHQTFVNGRTGQFIDVIIDTIGSLLGCIIFFFIYKIIMKIKKKRGIQIKSFL